MMDNSIGAFLQSVRKEKNFTQKELADRIGVSDKTISKWENGNSVPDTTLLKPLCDELDISINELLSGERLLPEAYSENAEKNMMNLLESNQTAKKNNLIPDVLGVLIFFSAIIMTIINSKADISWYSDIISLLIPTCICIGMVIICKSKGKSDITEILRKIIIPSGLIPVVIQGISVLYNLDNLLYLGPNIATMLLTLLYTLVAYLVIVVLQINKW